MMMDVRRGPRGGIVIHIGAAFDAAAATRLAGWLREVPPHEPLVIEFAGRECHDFGLAQVASDLAKRERLVVRGLSRHQEKLLRYLGVELERGGASERAAG
jgi:hypothetical protein